MSGGGTTYVKRRSDGIRNSRVGELLRFDWNGRRLSADWHIKMVGNTRSSSMPSHILLLDDQTQQIIVSDMPA